MLIEVLGKPLRVNLPQDGGELLLRPGVPVDLSPGLAWKLLTQAKGKVRVVVHPDADWLTLWRLVAEISSGLDPSDHRLPSVMAAIGECDVAFTQDNKAAFLLAIEEVITVMETPTHQCGLF